MWITFLGASLADPQANVKIDPHSVLGNHTSSSLAYPARGVVCRDFSLSSSNCRISSSPAIVSVPKSFVPSIMALVSRAPTPCPLPELVYALESVLELLFPERWRCFAPGAAASAGDCIFERALRVPRSELTYTAGDAGGLDVMEEKGSIKKYVHFDNTK